MSITGLTRRIKPGDSLSSTDFNTNMTRLENLAETIDDTQFIAGAIDTRHINGNVVFPYVENVAGPLNPGAYTRIAPAAPTNYACIVGQGVLVIGSCRVHATGAASASLRIDVDGAPVSPVRTIELPNLYDRPIQVVWMFTATAVTHAIELMGIEANADLRDIDLQILAIKR